jgi:uncharacterized protein YjbI with pentapeptide repeats
LLTAATTVTHRQLFLAEPVKLPVLNIDLPLWGFFWLAPILFVIFHAYVLIQLILLARTAAAYDAAVAKLAEQDNFSPEANASLRQRLANTLFAQILAGSPREREGWFGSLLKAMAWITLVIAPILILLAFQFMFLPYHSHIATWTHRMLILLELVVAFRLWPLVLNPQRDFQWPNWRWRIGDMAVRIVALFRPGESWRHVVPLAAMALFILLPLSLATFPGEPHVNLFTGQALDGVQCRRWIQREFDFADMRFDRLALARVDVVDHDKLEKIQQATSKAGERAYQGERTRILRDRDLNCGDFSDYADLRRVDLTGAHLRDADFQFSKLEGVSLNGSSLQGASFNSARLQGASLFAAELQGASFKYAKLEGASFDYANLQGASLDEAGLQGTSLESAKLEGASFDYANLRGASFDYANLRGASFDEARLQGASLQRAHLQGASLNSAELQGASLSNAYLQGASLNSAQLQGASLKDASLSDAILSGAWIWRASDAACANARMTTDPRNDAVVALTTSFSIGGPTLDQIEKVITEWVSEIPEEPKKEQVREMLRERLTTDSAKNDTAKLREAWDDCARKSRKISQEQFDGRHVMVLRETVCNAGNDGAAIGKGIVRNWISKNNERPEFNAKDDEKREFTAKLARALLGEDGKPCIPAKAYDQDTKGLLRQAAGPLPAAMAPK